METPGSALPTCKGIVTTTHCWMSPSAPDRVTVKKCDKQTGLSLDGYCLSCCPKCKELDRNCVGVAMNDTALYKAMQVLIKHMHEYHGMAKHKSHTGNGAHQGAFAFTLTKSPDDDLSEEDMIAAVTKIMNQKSCPTKRFIWYIEYGEPETKTHPHIHGMYETERGGRIEKKHWKRAWPIWGEGESKFGAGFRGGYHRPVRIEENYIDYVKKCADVRHGEFNISLPNIHER